MIGAVLGATAGIVALFYFVGAVAVWLRLRRAGLPADQVLEHYSRERLTIVGVKGLAAVATISLIILILVFVLDLMRSKRLRDELRKPGSIEEAIRPARRIRLGLWGMIGVAALPVILAALAIWAAFVGWRLFSMALGALVVVCIYTFLRLRPRNDSGGWAMLLVTVILSVSGIAILWQLDGSVYVQTVMVEPAPNSDIDTGVAYPYLGSTSDAIYVANLRRRQANEPGETDLKITQSVLEIPRSNITRLEFVSRPGTIYADDDAPAEQIPDVARFLWSRLKG
jgi:hypothetical protein